MNIENYKQEVLERLSKEKRFQNCQLVLQEYKKVNGVTLQGLSIANNKDGISTVVYLNDFYQDYKGGKDFNSILSDIASTLNNLCNFKLHKNKIFPKIIKTEGNEGYLKGKTHLSFLNCSILFYIDHTGHRAMDVTDQLMKAWNIQINNLLEIAKQNIEMQYVFLSMNQVIMEMVGENIEFDMNDTMHVLSNYNKNWGAGAIVNERILQVIYHSLEQNFYILPSSVHEVIIVRKTEHLKVEELKQMVREVNSRVVDPKDILGDDVYMYDGNEQKLFFV